MQEELESQYEPLSLIIIFKRLKRKTSKLETRKDLKLVEHMVEIYYYWADEIEYRRKFRATLQLPMSRR